ncbi:helix-turn-helix transcriptional regulator [Bacillus paranthracis]|uniref:Helix-turn-helix transcriptional regulator n=1 Tax=Bacillus paranthracis TaxID=2026186 RepID=A0AAJ1NEZ0_9BACI|nr:helix-turn-helix transcriptional regulator [Bacillus paranthracis]MDG0949882.1 helix-turn-helix transcriptional regulator [Bacillus paranthracis]MDG0955695.1 helix-turn-helix transcriptional regulator [Bacillus paranthracis]
MSVNLKSNIGEWIEKSGYRKNFIATKLGITVKQLNNYTTGISFPSIHRLYELACIFNCKVDDLYEVQKNDPAN